MVMKKIFFSLNFNLKFFEKWIYFWYTEEFLFEAFLNGLREKIAWRKFNESMWWIRQYFLEKVLEKFNFQYFVCCLRKNKNVAKESELNDKTLLKPVNFWKHKKIDGQLTLLSYFLSLLNFILIKILSPQKKIFKEKS